MKDMVEKLPDKENPSTYPFDALKSQDIRKTIEKNSIAL